jgi:hypothetical protein
MTTPVNIELDDELARIYVEASPEEQRRVQVLLSAFLRGLTNDSTESLSAIMDRMGNNAQARGLTAEILESLLNDGE